MANAKSLPCDELRIRATRPVPACASRKEWVLAAAVLGSAMSYIDESVVNVALPRIESALDSTLPAMQWILNAYTLCISALLLLGGAAADRFGRRRIFLAGLTPAEIHGQLARHATETLPRLRSLMAKDPL